MKTLNALLLGLLLALSLGCSRGQPFAAEDSKAVSDEAFAAATGAPGLVLVDFFATWCGPCKTMNPILAELEKTYEGRVRFIKVDVDQNPKLAGQFKVEAIPTFVLHKDGEVVALRQGGMGREEMKAWLEKYLGSSS